MLRRYNRLLVACYVIADLLSAAAAFLLAYFIRFDSWFVEFVPVTKTQPPFSQYLYSLPVIALLVPAAFQLQGLYRLRRGRTRVDDFFAVLVGSLLAVLAGVALSLYARAYVSALSDFHPISRAVWLLFLGLTITLTYTSREIVRDLLQRRWRAGIGLKHVLIVGSGDLGRMVADRILDHSELGFKLVGFADDQAADTDAIGYRGLPVLGTVAEAPQICQAERIDEIYVALPLDEHLKMLGIVEFASRECINVHVIPDLLQFIALRARLEDLDGLPVIGINDVPLRGLNSVIKRLVDVALSAAVLAVGAVPAAVVAFLIKRSSPGPAFYAQERMGLDGKGFTSTSSARWSGGRGRHQADLGAGRRPADDQDRAVAERFDLDELPQFWNVFGRMSIVDLDRAAVLRRTVQTPHPQCMLRHEVKAGITGWAESTLAGNTSLEKRIEFDLYIENWWLSSI